HHAQLDISPATVRVVMAELTAAGLLAKPHASAGGVPTQAGFRYYVDHLLRRRAPSASDRDGLTARLLVAGTEPGALVRAASRHLAGACTVTTVGRRPRIDDVFVERLELMALDGRRALAVLLLGDGSVRNRVIDVDAPLSPDELGRARGLFNARWGGHALSDVRRALRAELDACDRAGDPTARLLHVAEQALPEDESPDDALVVEGRTFLLGRADEADDISSVMRALEDKRLLLRLLDELASEDGSQVIFGEETESDTLRACAVVSAPYRVGGRCLGAVAVVGPVRMNYARIIPWVEYTAEAISGILHTGRAA
ncbi:MAG: heat-inducible transcription repressor HrcA, partial [Myxococcales bacterium]|nr:heat-inducible transcription repressor HrcA [Myxococcales bacterium]